MSVLVTPAGTLDDSCMPVRCVYPCTAECLSASTSPGNDAAGWARRSSGSYSKCDTATPGRSCAHRNVNQVWAAPRWCQIRFQLRGCSRLSSKLVTFLPSAGQTSLRCVINRALGVHAAKIGMTLALHEQQQSAGSDSVKFKSFIYFNTDHRLDFSDLTR